MSVSGPWMVSFCAVVLIGLVGCGGTSNYTTPGQGGASTNSATVVTYTFTGAAPAEVATRIGTGAFTQATLQSGKLTLSVPSGTNNYAVAWVCPTSPIFSPAVNYENVLERSIQDGTAFIQNGDCTLTLTVPQLDKATLLVDASAISGAGEVTISNYCSDLTTNWIGVRSVSCSMPTGTYDVFVAVEDKFRGNPLAVRILRSQTIPGPLNGGNPLIFAASDQTVPQTITYKNLPAANSVAYLDVLYYTAGGKAFPMTPSISVPASTASYSAVPMGTAQSGDYYIFSAAAFDATPDGTLLAETVSSGGAQTITFPPTPWSATAPLAAAFPTFDENYAGFAGMPSVSRYASITWTLGATSTNPLGTLRNFISVLSTENYQNGATTLTIPDLTGLTGFIAPAPSGTSVHWYESLQQGSVFQATPPSGSEQAVIGDGAYTEP